MNAFRIRGILDNALRDNRISCQEWELILEFATEEEEIVLIGENNTLVRLVTLLEGGAVSVEGVSQEEILRRLSVFA